MDKGAASNIVSEAVSKTPASVFAFGGGILVTTVCVVAGLQFSGMSAPLQRIVNAKALEIEVAAQRTTTAADNAMAASDNLVASLGNIRAKQGALEQELENHEARLKRLEWMGQRK